MRVVVDTNILVSAVLGGALKVIVDAWKAQKFTLIVSEPIVHEYLDVLNRPKFKLTQEELSATTDFLLTLAEFVTPLETVSAIVADPTDNKFLDAALAANADYLVSGDAHILDLESFRGIPILTARKFIDRLPD
ncbi:MAG: putative toxin-antitoxin system toxin component, PIN family [Caldilinea sp.]|nr:putative toxin-antitoxin system toxin component, PIN family [Caldilinea sp.]MCB0051552.1 putative toxin-antitoxin system toxin component, PIN family [Caldilinea sp.]MCO5212841.1 putative toxin-antitoxin system toxin component, PIN family [Caldilinea sp.]MCW5844154.1 putative toxin-antitoxin system toxin component, PIN family [Caldilinea sp.]